MSNLDNLKWFDGYTGQKTVIFDDFRGTPENYSQVLRLTDRYPMRVPIKGGYVAWVPTTVIFTCPGKPEDTWPFQSESLGQLYRRISKCLCSDSPNFRSEVLNEQHIA